MTEEMIYTPGEKEKIYTESGADSVSAGPGYTASDILERIDRILNNTAEISGALETLAKMPPTDSGECGAPGDIAGAQRAQAIGDIVKCRETTNQRTLELLNKMYDDLKHLKESDGIAALRHLASEALGSDVSEESKLSALETAIAAIEHISSIK